MPIQKNMTLEDAKAIVAEALAAHGDGLDLRPLLNALPAEKRPVVARYFAELRKRGDIKTTLSVNAETGEVSHNVRLPKAGE